MLDSGLNEEITSWALVMDGNVEVESVVEEDDGDVKVINVVGNNSMDEDSSDVDGETKKMKDEEDVESDGSVVVKKGDSWGKRKVVGSSEKVDESRLNESVVGSNRQMEAECFDPTELDKEVDEKSQVMSRLNKKQKLRGRPPKLQGEIGFSREILDEIDVEEVGESTLLIGTEQKKQKCRGRPRKTQGEIGTSRKILDENDVEEVDERALLISMQNEDGSFEITGDNMEYVKTSEENNDHTTAEDTITNTNTLKLKNSIGGADRRQMEQRLVRDQIVSMIMKAGWMIEYRPRQNGRHLDTVYIDMQGKTHWSVPKAYFTLKMKIEKGVACNEVVSAFTSIPKEELSVLLRPVSKVRSNKNMKKNIGKNACKAEIIITRVAQPKRHKKLDKESKEKKATLTPTVTQKVVGSSKKVEVENDGVRVSSRVLRSSVKMTSGSTVQVDESRLNESVVGSKRRMEADCFDPTELDKEVDEKSQVMGRLNKKQKLRGRPPKLQGEIGFSRKILDENDVEEVGESALLIGKEQKKQKCHGRPPKTQGEIGTSREILEENDVEDVDERALLIGKEQKNQKRLGRPPNVQNEDGSSEITGDNKEYVKTSEENNDHTTTVDTVKNTNTLKLKNSIEGADSRLMQQQLVRDQILSMIMKAGWTIEYRRRQKYREYLDAVYIDKQGKTHWSVTKAYSSLKMKIENGVACNEEVSAFTTIPNEELSLLLRSFLKVRSDMNMKKKNGKKKACEAEIIITGVAQLRRHKKKLDMESKEKKTTQTSANNSSSIKRGPKVTQKDRQGRKACLLARSTSKGDESRQCRFCIIQQEAESFEVAHRFRCYHAR